MSGQHMSFTVTRSGLKSGFYVPARLRLVDTLTIVSWVPVIIMIIAIGIASLGWVDRFGLGIVRQNRFAFCAYVIVVMFVAGRVVPWTATRILRIAFRISGLMTEEEAQSFPLRADKQRVDPWPETWQRPGPFLAQWNADECATEHTDEPEPMQRIRVS